MTDSPYTAIKNSHAVVSFLGKWPSFDDFEVVSILLKRGNDEDMFWPTLTIKFFGFRQEVHPESPERNNCIIVLRFGGIGEMTLNGFNHQNALNGFVVKTSYSDDLKRDLFAVELIQGFGVGAKFECEEIAVVSVTPTTARKWTGIVGE